MEMFFLRQGLKAPLVMVPTLVAPSAVKICGDGCGKVRGVGAAGAQRAGS